MEFTKYGETTPLHNEDHKRNNSATKQLTQKNVKKWGDGQTNSHLHRITKYMLLYILPVY